jgi:glycosyltransferase involved in cell wall biosynthesis
MPTLAGLIRPGKPTVATSHQEAPATRVKRWLCPPELISTARVFCEQYRPHVVIAEYVFLSECLDAAPTGALKVIDTIDAFSEKKGGVIAHGIDDPLAISPEEERERLLKADLVIAIQAREAKLMKRLVPERQVITVGIDFDISAEQHEFAIEPGRILVVGSDNPLNLHGLRAFLAEAWPTIADQCPWATLRVVGKVGKAVEEVAERIELAGWVENLAAVYGAADVVINPTVAGTGLKIKTVEALCHGCAIVAWPNGVDGLANADPPAFRVAASWPAFADAVIGLLRDPTERARLQNSALAYARASFDRDRVYAPLKRELDDHCMALSSNSSLQADTEAGSV